MKRLFREARIKEDALLCFENISLQEPGQKRLFEWILTELSENKKWEENPAAPVFLFSEKWDTGLDTGGLRCMEYTVVAPITPEEQYLLWKGLLKGVTFQEEIHTNQLAARYQLTPGAIVRAVEDIERQQLAGIGGKTEKALFQAARNQLEHKLGNDAVRIKVVHTMDDLVLPDSQKQQLCKACDLVKYRHQVYTQWGFDKKWPMEEASAYCFTDPPEQGKPWEPRRLPES